MNIRDNKASNKFKYFIVYWTLQIFIINITSWLMKICQFYILTICKLKRLIIFVIFIFHDIVEGCHDYNLSKCMNANQYALNFLEIKCQGYKNSCICTFCDLCSSSNMYWNLNWLIQTHIVFWRLVNLIL